jgi:hypothetical protein
MLKVHYLVVMLLKLLVGVFKMVLHIGLPPTLGLNHGETMVSSKSKKVNVNSNLNSLLLTQFFE